MWLESSAKYLGSWLTSHGKDTMDVEKRIKQASGALGSLLKCVFSQSEGHHQGVGKGGRLYNSLILSILLYGPESWALTKKHRDKLRGPHAVSVCVVCVSSACGMCRSTASLRRSLKTAWACSPLRPTWCGGGFGG
jgi:hypothetical protein